MFDAHDTSPFSEENIFAFVEFDLSPPHIFLQEAVSNKLGKY